MEKEGKASAYKFLLAALGAVALFGAGYGQSFNIDFEVFFGPPELGHGAPSSSFGGAAGQQGHWTAISGANGVPEALADLNGQASTVTITKTATSPGGTGGFNFTGNTGDYALLLNDAEQVATLVDGGNLTYTIGGLAAGVYEIYTYAAHFAGLFSETPVFVPEAEHTNTQVVTGPMPGNAFQYLITHSIHLVDLQAQGDIHVSITQPPNHPQGMTINGLQIVAVPEPTPFVMLGALLLILCKRRQ